MPADNTPVGDMRSSGRAAVLERWKLQEAKQQEVDPQQEVARAEAGDATLTLMDLSANRQFASLDALGRSAIARGQR